MLLLEISEGCTSRGRSGAASILLLPSRRPFSTTREQVDTSPWMLPVRSRHRLSRAVMLPWTSPATRTESAALDLDDAFALHSTDKGDPFGDDGVVLGLGQGGKGIKRILKGLLLKGLRAHRLLLGLSSEKTHIRSLLT